MSQRKRNPTRRRGRPRGKPLSRKELTARRANLERARAAPKEVIYRPTEKRMAASLANLRKAIAARRSDEANERVRLNALKHGVYSRELVEESVRRLGESERDFAAHRERFAQLFVPRDDWDAALVQEMANLAWRRLRLFRAQALREARDLRRMLEEFGEARLLTAEETQQRAWVLFAVLDDCDRVLKDAAKLRFEMQTLLRELVRQRGGTAKVQPVAAESSEEQGSEEQGLGFGD